jgi:hypothetical protein
MIPEAVASWDALADRVPACALVAGSVFYGRRLHRGALLADGYVRGANLICPVHDRDYRCDSGVSEYNHHEVLPKFAAWREAGQVWVDATEIAAWERAHPQPCDREAYLGLCADGHGAAEEPHVGLIQSLARSGAGRGHGPVAAMALGADAVAMHAIGCIAMRACHTNARPVGIATQKPHLVSRLVVEILGERLRRFLEGAVLTTGKRDMARLAGASYCGMGA